MSFLGERAIPGVEMFDGRTFRRAIRTGSGDIWVIGLRPHASRPFITLDLSTDDPSEVAGFVQTVRTVLDLDTDPTPIDQTLERDPALRRSVRTTPGMRVPGTFDGFELAVRAVLGQQVSVRAARTFAGRIAVDVGTTLPAALAVNGLTHVFPTAERLVDASLDMIGLTRRRIDTLHRLAQLVADGALDLSGTADRTRTEEALLAIPGIGPWTVAYISMRALRDPDAFPASDLGIRLGFERLGLSTAPGAIREHAERWRPWRSYATMRIWRTLGVTP